MSILDVTVADLAPSVPEWIRKSAGELRDIAIVGFKDDRFFNDKNIFTDSDLYSMCVRLDELGFDVALAQPVFDNGYAEVSDNMAVKIGHNYFTQLASRKKFGDLNILYESFLDAANAYREDPSSPTNSFRYVTLHPLGWHSETDHRGETTFTEGDINSLCLDTVFDGNDLIFFASAGYTAGVSLGGLSITSELVEPDERILNNDLDCSASSFDGVIIELARNISVNFHEDGTAIDTEDR